MSESIFLGSIIGPLYLILGLSVLLYTKQWVKVMKHFETEHFGMLALMLFNIIFGLMIIQKHNLWEWSPYLVITLTGWGAFLKGAFYLLAPESMIKSTFRWALKYGKYMKIDGVLATGLGAWLSYLVYMA